MLEHSPISVGSGSSCRKARSKANAHGWDAIHIFHRMDLGFLHVLLVSGCVKPKRIERVTFDENAVSSISSIHQPVAMSEKYKAEEGLRHRRPDAVVSDLLTTAISVAKKQVFKKALNEGQVCLVTDMNVKARTKWILLMAAFIDLSGGVLLAGAYPHVRQRTWRQTRSSRARRLPGRQLCLHWE